MIILRRRKPDLLLGVSPEDDVRENVGYYDEEGAGRHYSKIYFIKMVKKSIMIYCIKYIFKYTLFRYTFLNIHI